MPRSIERSLIFRLNDNGQGPEIIQQVFLENGWQEYDEEVHHENEWNLWWRTSRFRNSDYDQLHSWQWLNHYPRSTVITKKDCLARNMKRMKGVYGPLAYNFSPIAFNLPNDYTRFVAEYTKHHEKKNDVCWICKPADLSRGRGIFIFRELSELQYDCNAVVQQYISNPLLISGYKFDLRLYVIVPSFHPLQVYIYEEGLVRFGTEKFDLNSLGNQYAHLTNTSINKHSPNYMMDKERVGPGCKWTLRQLRHYFHQVNINDNQLWGKIVNIIILTIVMQGAQVPKVEHCFELYGFDIMIDDDLKPWLLEVNFSPALSSDCQADIIVKKGMLTDLLQMIAFSEEDKLHGGDAVRSSHSHKMYGSTSSISSSEHRHSFGYGQRKKSSEHLPKIRSSHSMMSGGEVDDVSNDGEPQVIPIIPGCGLPSVQQTVLHQSVCVQPYESAISGCESKGVCKVADHASKNNIKKSAKTNQVHPSDQEAKVVNPHHMGSPLNNMHLGGDQTVNQNTKQPLQKRDSKVSAQSDSGFSSYSGSSDNSDVVSQYEEGTNSPSRILTKDNKLTSSQSSGIHNTHKNKEKFSSIRRHSEADGGESGSVLSQVSNQVTTRQSMGHLSKRPPMSSHYKMAHTLKGYSKPPSNQSSKQKSHFVPFISNPAKPHSSPLHPIYKQGSGSIKGHTVVRSQWYNKSDSKSSQTETGIMPCVGSRTPPGRVGDFIRVFPFNDATKKCSLGNMDIKTVVRECHKLLRERKRAAKGQSQGEDHQDGWSSNECTISDNIFDMSYIWKPLLGDSVPH
ncbi:hypothetical protein LSH36_93g04010 [Paralvinella palmiformis]|uniref:Tubulin polyglutamylase TTLL2 n=1 Tax=Paralvinella palmiformis TaxID=53620 RepID=A0AAD9K234_9ANNE|nr:hypothetical protein LSH36_93g04010 [Paralvinella palmiformis]